MAKIAQASEELQRIEDRRRLALEARHRRPGLHRPSQAADDRVHRSPRRFDTACLRAGLERLRFHHLRHLFGSLTLSAGVDLATVSRPLGHSSVQLTASTYLGQVPAPATPAGTSSCL
jgi:integrase